MLKKIAAYGAIAVGAAGFVLSAAPAQAQTVSANGMQVVSSYSNDCYLDGTCRRPWSISLRDFNKRFLNDFNKRQRNESNNSVYACDTHAAGALDHQLNGRNEENAKCAQSSFNRN